jgi:hypothetical protein
MQTNKHEDIHTYTTQMYQRNQKQTHTYIQTNNTHQTDKRTDNDTHTHIHTQQSKPSRRGVGVLWEA